MDSSKHSPVVLFFVFLIPLICSDTVQSLCCFDRIFSFGDSNADAGNSCLLHSGCLSLRPPYGETYFHKPNGRNSDGRIIVDFFGMYQIQILWLHVYNYQDHKTQAYINTCRWKELMTCSMQLKHMDCLFYRHPWAVIHPRIFSMVQILRWRRHKPSTIRPISNLQIWILWLVNHWALSFNRW
jgi:GDSL-like Lipase/Acylhydrolase